MWIVNRQGWVRTLFLSILNHSTLYPLLCELSSKPHLSPDELEHASESISTRSKMMLNGLLATIGFTLSTSSTTKISSEIVLPVTALTWCIINRVYYEGLPVSELQKRVQSSGPAAVAILYGIPEIFQVIFMMYKVVVYGKWIGAVIMGTAALIQLSLRGLPCIGARRRYGRGALPV
ncbi:hypothetical protein DL96DRAFT_1645946 [Flagelloscypha sp. PMI_526]|nr:hypothetical protein DL96DRAFT_1645946 [Flagelloscypha sp. PMI_526]